MPITVPEVTIAKNIFIHFSSLEYFINIAFQYRAFMSASNIHTSLSKGGV
jgi:hypothetical protein